MHIDGSVLHPLTELDPAEVKSIVGASECVVVCASDSVRRERPSAAKGIGRCGEALCPRWRVKAWDAAGLPLIRGKGVISLERQVRIAAGSFVLTGWCWASSSTRVVCAFGFCWGRIGLRGHHGYLWDGNAARPHAVE